MRVAIQGDGIAAWCCARLLTNSGIEIVVKRSKPRRRRFILISDPVQQLLCEIAGDVDLFRDASRIRKRHVLWGSQHSVEHSSVVVDEESLVSNLWAAIPYGAGDSDWTIASISGSENAANAELKSFGNRCACIADVEVREAEPACWIEALERGWLFLIGPVGSLIAVGAPPQELLGESRLIAPQIVRVDATQPPVGTHPRILDPVFGASWLACGSAAMALDPICGDGSGHAVREAILATAVLRGGAAPQMLQHYQARLRIAFERHLSLCRHFYRTGSSGEWWAEQVAEIDRGLGWLRGQPAHDWRYRLQGLDLILL